MRQLVNDTFPFVLSKKYPMKVWKSKAIVKFYEELSSKRPSGSERTKRRAFERWCDKKGVRFKQKEDGFYVYSTYYHSALAVTFSEEKTEFDWINRRLVGKEEGGF